MKLIVCVSIIALLAGCATTPESGDESVFDVIEEAGYAPSSVTLCPSGGVMYCVGDGSSMQRCACADPYEVQHALDRAF
jgi:hypothetical protein